MRFASPALRAREDSALEANNKSEDRVTSPAAVENSAKSMRNRPRPYGKRMRAATGRWSEGKRALTESVNVAYLSTSIFGPTKR